MYVLCLQASAAKVPAVDRFVSGSVTPRMLVAINFIGAGNYFRAVGVPLGTAFACCVGSEPSLGNVMASGYIAKGLIASLKLTRDT